MNLYVSGVCRSEGNVLFVRIRSDFVNPHASACLVRVSCISRPKCTEAPIPVYWTVMKMTAICYGDSQVEKNDSPAGVVGTEEAAGLHFPPSPLGLGRTPFLDQSKGWKPDPSLCPFTSLACGIQFLLLSGRKKSPALLSPARSFTHYGSSKSPRVPVG